MKNRVIPALLLLIMLTGAALADAASDLKSGHEKMTAGDLSGALYYLQNSLSDAKFALRDYAQYDIAEIYFNHGNYDLAGPEYEKIPKESPIFKTALLKAAKSFELSGQTEKTIGAYEKFLPDFPNDPNAAEAGYDLARNYEKIGNVKAAYNMLNEVDLYHPLTDYAKKSRVMIKKLAALYHMPVYKAKPKELFKSGMAAFNNGDYDEAEAIFERLAREYPHSKYAGEAFMMVGRSEFSGGKIDDAIVNIKKSLSYTPEKDKSRNLYYLGRAYGRRGRYVIAANYMSKIIDNYPDSEYSDNACYYLGVYYEYLDSPQAAVATYLYLADRYPASSYVNNVLFRAGIYYYKKYDFDTAYKIFGLAKVKNPGEDTPKCLLWWGKLAERKGSTEAAAGIYYYLADRYDHTYASYRAKEKLLLLGYEAPKGKIIPLNSGAQASDNSGTENDDIIAKTDEQLEKNRADNAAIQENIERYRELVDLGLMDFAAIEGKKILESGGGADQESAQATMARILERSGEFRTPILLSEGKVKDAVLAGKPDKIDPELWQFSYPKGFWNYVLKYSQKNQLDPFLTLAVIREESRFNPRALSHSNAHGLMQIIPSTGKLIAKDLKIYPFRRSMMYEANTNIMMGTYYLKNLVEEFRGNVFLALAGYNGGSGRVRKWVKNWYNGDSVNLDIDEFIEYIPLRETRNYVQKVMGSYYEYKRLYGGRS